MNLAEFQHSVLQNPQAVVVDLWAPWCAPCRAMEPAFQQASQQYAGQVEVVKINADESPEVLKALGVMGIPTVIGFAGGKEILRRTGIQSLQALELVFDAALQQRKPDIVPPAPIDRVVRSLAGLALLGIGISSGPNWLLLALGGGLLFSAFYDRCPIYRAIAPRLSGWLQRAR
jgi:thioredoxin 1